MKRGQVPIPTERNIHLHDMDITDIIKSINLLFVIRCKKQAQEETDPNTYVEIDVTDFGTNYMPNIRFKIPKNNTLQV